MLRMMPTPEGMGQLWNSSVRGSSFHSVIRPVAGSSRPVRLPYMPAHQIIPSGSAVNGSCA